MPNPNPTALDYVYGRMSSGGCQHISWVVTVDDPVLGLTVGQKLRESVVAGVGVFWRVVGEKFDLPSHPDVTKIDFPSSGGGGGGGTVNVNTTDTEYLRWEVTEADTTLGLAKGDYVIQSIINNVSTWRKFGTATALASAPDTAKLRPESSGGSLIEYRVVTAHGTSPSAFVKDEILWQFVDSDGDVVWRREGSKTPIATAPDRTKLERITGAASTGNASGAVVIAWRVEIAHNGLTVGLKLREYPQPDGSSKWQRLDTGAILTTAPNRDNLSDSFDAVVNGADVGTAAITSNQLTIIGLLGRLTPSDVLSVKGAVATPVTLIVPRRSVGQRNVLTKIAAGYTGGAMPANNTGGNLSVDWGDGLVHYATLISPGVFVLMQSDNGERATKVADANQTSTVGQITLTLDAVPNCRGEISVANRVEGSVNVPAPRTATDVYIEHSKYISSPTIIYYPAYTGSLWDAKRASDLVIEPVAANEDISAFAGSQTITVSRVYDQTPAARHHTPYGQEPLAYISGTKVAWGANQTFDFDAGRGLQNITGIAGNSFIVIAVVNEGRNTGYHQVMDGIAKRSGGLMDGNVNGFHPNPVYPISYRIDGVEATAPSAPFPASFLTNTPHILSFVMNAPDLSGGTLMGTYTGGGGGGGNERQGTTMIFDGSLSEADYLLVIQDIAAKEGITLP